MHTRRMSTQTAQWRVPEWTFADRLRKIRTDSGMHQREFATALGVTASAYAAWESGRNLPANLVSVAKRIEMLTGVPAAWTLGLETQNGPHPGRGEGFGLPRVDSNHEPADYWPGDVEDVVWHEPSDWWRAA